MNQDGRELEFRAQGRLGTVLRGKYRLDRVLGVGGMAVVYLATHRNHAQFALKMLHPELSLQESVRSRFLREGYAANSVKHPGAVLVVDDDVAEDGAAFLVMELLDGMGVDHLKEGSGGRLPVRIALGIAHQLLDVLAAAHPKGIVHRDIKPANLFVTKDGVVKVLDFGIARARDVAASSVGVTGSGMLLGTPAYMPPEQALGRSSEVDALTDVWAVGASIFTLVTGEYVHRADNPSEMLVQAATVPARSLASVAPETPGPIVAVVDAALSSDKAGRWQGAAAMREGLEESFRSAYGVAPSRDELAAFVAEALRAIVPLSVSATAQSPGARPEPVPPQGAALETPAANPSKSPERDPSPPPRSPSGPTGTLASEGIEAQARSADPWSAPRMPGGTTAEPVSSYTEATAGKRASVWRLVALAALGGVAVTVIALKLVGARHGAPSPAIETQLAASASPTESAPLPSDPATAAAPSASASASTSASATTVATESAPAPAKPAPSTAAPKPASAPASHAPLPTSVPAAPVVSAKPNCNPDYVLDARGQKHFKPECFH